MVTRRDYQLISIIACISAVLALPILGNLRPTFWSFSFGNILALLLGSLTAFNAGLFTANLITKKYPAFFKFAKYAATGVMNSLTDLGLFNLGSVLFNIYSGPLIIVLNCFSFAVAVTHSYFWSNGWVFKREGAVRSASEYLKFFAVTTSGVVINTIIVYILTTHAAVPASISPAGWENIAKLVAVPISVLWNYLGYRLFVFK